MLETSARLLKLLGLLQTHRDWTGRDLAERLGVSTRTIRTDVERLRTLGYPVDATSGVAGGYRLGAGAALPPLLLDDDEAVAVAVGLRTAAGGSVTGIEETSVRALAKLEQVLPSRLRHRVNAVTRRDVEPHRLVSWGRRWYLVAWDNERRDWRTFRVDRLTPKVPTGPRFTPRELPEGDVASFVQRGAGAATWRFFARVLLHASADEVRAKLPPSVVVHPEGADRCVVEVGSDTPQMLTLYIGLLDVDFEVLDSPELSEHLETMAARFQRAAAPRARGVRR